MRKRLGDILQEQGLINEQPLAAALEDQRRTGARLGQSLVKLNFVTAGQVADALSQHLMIERVDLARRYLSPEIVDLIPSQVITTRHVLPVDVQDGILLVAMADPLDINVIDDLQRLTGRIIQPLVATEEEILEAYQRTRDIALSAKELFEDYQDQEAEKEEPAQEYLGDAPGVRLVNLILEQALAQKASDIHLEPHEARMKVRYRIDGLLRDMMEIPRHLQNDVNSRIKIMAGLDITERRKPQDGRFQLHLAGQDVDLRVSSLPTVYGEKIVVRVLSNRDGYFAQSGLSGEVEVSISKPSFTFKPQKRTVNAATELLFTGEGEIYTVTGEVLDGERGVEKAVVTFQWGEGDGQVTLETLTDSSGRFSQTGLSGPVDVSVTKDGYDPAAKKATREQNHLVFNLSPSKYSVTVEAKRTNGAGIEGANITVWKGGTIIRTAQTTNDGTWTFNDLVGAVTIQVAKEGWVFNPTQAEVDRAASVVFIGSQAGYTVSGIVQSTEGEPIQGATLEFAFQDGSGRKLYAQSDERGEFSQSGLSGTVDVTVKKPGYTFTPPTETVEGPTQLSFVGQAETYTINGRVLRADSLSGVDGVTVTARRGDKIVASATTENGFFALQNLTGEVTVRAERQGWEFDPPQITVDWTDQDTEILFLGCEQGYTISGRVEETGTGNPIPYAVITFVQDGETIREILTNEYGFFSESGFTGTVQVQASKPGFAFAGEGYTVTGPRELLFSGTGTTYSVSGRVIDQESYKGLSGALITFELLDESGNPTGLEIDVQSDEDGQFSLSGLSGEYTVTASLPGFTFSQIHRVSKETHGLTFRGLARP
ncbi:MAG TPA: ATPase, T2SS/T4P/T4SS family [Limnochordia bacterium]|nr:ATPase, T2SS/T4P/T4SS family [Limnochordia bacterium]